jgi:hypothetical protein
MSIAAPRMKILAPIVIIIRRSGAAFPRGLIASRSKASPTAVETAMARKTAGKTVYRSEPVPDQRVNCAVGKTGQGVLDYFFKRVHQAVSSKHISAGATKPALI